MKLVTLNDKTHLVASSAEKEGTTTIRKAYDMNGATSVTASVIASYLQKEKLKTLVDIQLTGMQAMQTRALTEAEQIIVDAAKAQYKLAEAQAMPELVNKTFRAMLAG